MTGAAAGTGPSRSRWADRMHTTRTACTAYAARIRRSAAAMARRLTGPGWLCAAMTGFGAFGFALFGWHECLAIAAVSGTMLALAMAMTFGRMGCEASLSVEASRLQADASSRIVMRFANPGRERVTGLRGRLLVGADALPFAVPALDAGQDATVTLPFAAVARGVAVIGPLAAYRGDPLGLARDERSLAPAETVMVHPRAVPLPQRRANGPFDMDGLPSGGRTDEGWAFRGLREYVPGDDPRRIHWVSSAKTGVPMVREHEVTRQDAPCLLLDADPAHYADAGEFEHAVAAFASIGIYALGHAGTVTLRCGPWNAKPDSVARLLDLCSVLPPWEALPAQADADAATWMAERSPLPAWGWTPDACAEFGTAPGGLPAMMVHAVTGSRANDMERREADASAEFAIASTAAWDETVRLACPNRAVRIIRVDLHATEPSLRVAGGTVRVTVRGESDLHAIWGSLP